MKDKIKARYEQLKSDPFSQGMLVGGVIATTTVIGCAKLMHLNFDATGLYVPDNIINALTQGDVVAACKNGTRIALVMIPDEVV